MQEFFSSAVEKNPSTGTKKKFFQTFKKQNQWYFLFSYKCISGDLLYATQVMNFRLQQINYHNNSLQSISIFLHGF